MANTDYELELFEQYGEESTLFKVDTQYFLNESYAKGFARQFATVTVVEPDVEEIALIEEDPD